MLTNGGVHAGNSCAASCPNQFRCVTGSDLRDVLDDAPNSLERVLYIIRNTYYNLVLDFLHRRQFGRLDEHATVVCIFLHYMLPQPQVDNTPSEGT